MPEKISTAEAIELMFDFIDNNLVDGFEREGNEILLQKDGIDIVVIATATPIRPASSYIEQVKANSKAGIANGLIQVRSVSNYDGELLKPAVYIVDGKNRYYRNRKQLTAFEQEVVRLYGAPFAYFNPKDKDVELMSFIRFHQIPEYLQPEPGYDGSEQPLEVRQRRHIHEDLRESKRKISITDRIKGPFTFEVYERKRPRVLIARMAPYLV